MNSWRRSLARAGAILAATCSALSRASVALAAGPLGEEGSEIRTSEYTVDLYQGPVTASSRVIGLGGAYVSIAEGVEGMSQNPAAPAVRTPWSVDSFDYDLALGLTFPSSIRGNDFYNTGEGPTELDAGSDGLLFLTPAAVLQDGAWGYGVSISFANFSLSRRDETADSQRNLVAQFVELDLVSAYGFMQNQFSLGVGLRNVGLVVARENADGSKEDLFTTSGFAPMVGVLWRPEEQPFRVGAAYKHQVETQVDAASQVTANADGDLVLGPGGTDPNSIWLPRNMKQPWEASLGLALQFGPRPLNPHWIDPGRAVAELERVVEFRKRERQRRLKREAASRSPAELAALRAQADADDALDELELDRQARALRQALVRRARQMKRAYVLMSTELQVVGKSSSSVGVESFIQRRVARAGEKITLSPRVGLESEVVPGWLKLRAGSYGEPSRYRAGSPRLHGTFGFDLKTFPWTVFGLFDDGTEWRIGGALDAAARYFGWSASVGVWH
ncbi:MAG: hypothetical protein H6718_03405 [Polyangiaceae bacterium]|nr:hypothetical protein [Polyangiaceae bacterium]